MKGIIWALNSRSGIKQLEKIEKNYNLYHIETKRKIINQHGSFIEFENGDSWKVALACISSKGHRANISYIQYGIDYEFIDAVIRHSTTAYPFHAFNYFWGVEEEN